MTEQTPDEVAALISEAEIEAHRLLAVRISRLEELASDLRGFVATLSDREQFEPAIWQQGCDEIGEGVAELKKEWRNLQLLDGRDLLRHLKKLEVYPAAKVALSRLRQKLAIRPPEMVMFYKEYKTFKGRFFEDRVIFLDIDGVLLTFRNWISPDNLGFVLSPVEERIGDLQLDVGCIALIARLCDLTDASLVLASTWRKTWPHGYEALLDRLVAQGLGRELWHEDWMLPVLPGRHKSHEMASWTDGRSNVVALIIDDELPADPQPLHASKAAFLEISTREGFGFYNYVDALKFFEVEDKSAKIPATLPPRGAQSYPTMASGGPSRRHHASPRPSAS